MITSVSFEIAKLLKTKGFDEIVRTWHQRGDGISGLVEGKQDRYSRKGDAYISAPTIAEVVMWLYEKHGIWITVDTIGDKKIYPKWNYKLVDLSNSNSNIEWELHQLTISYEELIKNSFNSPTEAYETAIEYTLKNLIK